MGSGLRAGCERQISATPSSSGMLRPPRRVVTPCSPYASLNLVYMIFHRHTHRHTHTHTHTHTHAHTQEFDSSYSRNKPFRFTIGVGQVCIRRPSGARAVSKETYYIGKMDLLSSGACCAAPNLSLSRVKRVPLHWEKKPNTLGKETYYHRSLNVDPISPFHFPPPFRSDPQ